MARILLGWELGAGTGHSVKLGVLARLLRERGHEPVAAMQDIRGAPATLETWQAPLWSAQLTVHARPAATSPQTMGDILATLGLADAEGMRAMIAAWDRLLAAIRPDAVAAEFAPALMLAARGRVPVLALGTGFSLPPAHLPAFPSLTGKPAAHREARLLDGLNRALAKTGRPPLDALPRIFAAERTLAAVFRELDPYRAWRAHHAPPSLAHAVPPASGSGEEVFVYLNGIKAAPAALWQGLVGSGLNVRLYNPLLAPADRAALERVGIAVETRPVPIERIVERSRLLLSHGGMGLVSSALLAGLPPVVLPFDLEKQATADAIAALGLGWHADLRTLDAEAFARQLRASFQDAALMERARSAAPSFRARMAPSCDALAADALAEMAVA